MPLPAHSTSSPICLVIGLRCSPAVGIGRHHAVAFRLRNAVVMIGRAATELLPEPVVARLREPFEKISQAALHFLRACADALRERKNPPALDAAEQALSKFTATIEELRREGATRALPVEVPVPPT